MPYLSKLAKVCGAYVLVALGAIVVFLVAPPVWLGEFLAVKKGHLNRETWVVFGTTIAADIAIAFAAHSSFWVVFLYALKIEIAVVYATAGGCVVRRVWRMVSGSCVAKTTYAARVYA